MQKFAEMASSSDESTDKEEVPSKKTKCCGAAKYKTDNNKECFNDENYEGTVPIVLHVQRMFMQHKA